MKVAASSSDKGARGQCSDLERGMVKWNDATPSHADRQTVPKRRGAVVRARNIGKQKRRGDGMDGSASHAHLRGDASHGRTPEGCQQPCAQGRGEGQGVSNASRPCPRPALTPSTVWLRQLQCAGECNGARVCDGPDDRCISCLRQKNTSRQDEERNERGQGKEREKEKRERHDKKKDNERKGRGARDSKHRPGKGNENEKEKERKERKKRKKERRGGDATLVALATANCTLHRGRHGKKLVATALPPDRTVVGLYFFSSLFTAW